ncbi:MAG: DUF3667 domain-containing protein [Sphingobacteriales bacterium]|nr:MAG: DUF3667 domain-containing protein [Sphingobacteriales bacterium]
MSHNPHAEIVCPNCGHHATYNYCAQCGQPTHLHKDTFLGLILHFVAHYFHYDSKFWKTLKTLWLKPGALTIAYREKKRMRYIDPISLYIFVSAVFFLFFFSRAEKKYDKIIEQQTETTIESKTKDSTVTSDRGAQLEKLFENEGDSISTLSASKTVQAVDSGEDENDNFRRAADKLNNRPENLRYFIAGLMHNIPKVIFFMIPVMALILKLLFIRRKNSFFVDHGIFALHFHTFWFSIMLIKVLNPIDVIDNMLGKILILVGMIYFIVSAKRIYEISYRRSIFYSIIVGFLYATILLVVSLTGGLYAFYLEGAA